MDGVILKRTVCLDSSALCFAFSIFSFLTWAGFK